MLALLARHTRLSFIVTLGMALTFSLPSLAQDTPLLSDFGVELAVVSPGSDEWAGRALLSIASVAPGSEAEASGLVAGHIINTIEQTRYTGAVDDDIDIDALEMELAGYIAQRGFLLFSLAPSLEAALARRASPETRVPAILPRSAVVAHLGFNLGESASVTSVLPNTPASEAGMLIGDEMFAVGGSMFTGSPSAWILARVMEEVTTEFGAIELRVQRGGSVTVLEIPTRGVGEAF